MITECKNNICSLGITTLYQTISDTKLTLILTLMNKIVKPTRVEIIVLSDISRVPPSPFQTTLNYRPL
jgi:hypothetical protein